MVSASTYALLRAKSVDLYKIEVKVLFIAKCKNLELWGRLTKSDVSFPRKRLFRNELILNTEQTIVGFHRKVCRRRRYHIGLVCKIKRHTLYTYSKKRYARLRS